jgi:hypothetical protein
MWGFKKVRANRVWVKAAPLHGADRIGLASEAALHVPAASVSKKII